MFVVNEVAIALLGRSCSWLREDEEEGEERLGYGDAKVIADGRAVLCDNLRRIYIYSRPGGKNCRDACLYTHVG